MLMAMTLSPAAFAQEHAASISKVVRLNRAPVSKEILRVQLPRPVVTKLRNGLTILVVEQHKLPTVAFSLWVKTGALADPRELPGLAHFTAAMLREGTTHRSSAQLASDVDDLGATLGALADFGSSTSTVSASGLAENTDRILELMSDVVLNPTFPADELEKYKQRQLAELEQDRSSPQFLGREKFHAVLYRGFPAAVVSATTESVKRVTPAELKEFHDRYYAPSNAILGVVGDVKPDEILEIIKRHLDEWKSRAVTPPSLAALPPPVPATIYLVNRPNSVQTNIVIGDYSLRRTDPDFIPLTVTNRVLGGGPSARLFLNLREEHGYTYGAFSFFTTDTYRGAWQAQAEVQNKVTEGSLHEFMNEFKRIRDTKVPDDELDDARRSIIARFALSLEQPSALLNFWMTAQYYGLPQDYWDRYPEQVAKVSPDVVEATAKKYVDLDHLQIVCVGDGQQPGNNQGKPIKDILKQYGRLEVYDADGKRLD